MTPALQRQFDTYRDTRAAELFDIAAKLEEHRFSLDAGPVRDAAAQCRSAVRTAPHGTPDAGRTYWGYEITDLKIDLDRQRHCRPRAASMENVSGSLTVTVQEYLPESAETVGEGYNLLRRLDTDFYFDAELVVDGAPQAIRAAWHLDTHLYLDTESDAVHPRFHFQVGGERFDDLDPAIRGVFLPEAPRLPAAPLDGILAIDFVLSHYCGRTWQVLRELDPGYGFLRKGPMARYWLPYYDALRASLARLDEDPTGGVGSLLVPSIRTV